MMPNGSFLRLLALVHCAFHRRFSGYQRRSLPFLQSEPCLPHLPTVNAAHTSGASMGRKTRGPECARDRLPPRPCLRCVDPCVPSACWRDPCAEELISGDSSSSLVLAAMARAVRGLPAKVLRTVCLPAALPAAWRKANGPMSAQVCAAQPLLCCLQHRFAACTRLTTVRDHEACDWAEMAL